MQRHEFTSCLTVKQLREILKDWPDEREDGTPTEVWVGANGVTNEVFSVWPLDKDEQGSADLLLESDG